LNRYQSSSTKASAIGSTFVQDGGDISVKNIDRPIRIWKWHPSATKPNARTNAAKPQPNVATASIAALPFTNMSGDPEQEYFSDGISEDIITDFSKIADLLRLKPWSANPKSKHVSILSFRQPKTLQADQTDAGQAFVGTTPVIIGISADS